MVTVYEAFNAVGDPVLTVLKSAGGYVIEVFDDEEEGRVVSVDLPPDIARDVAKALTSEA